MCFDIEGILAFEQIPYDGFAIAGSKVLAWASRDSSKPGRSELSAGY